MRNERVFAGYLGLQALAGVAFWIVLMAVPSARAALELDAARPAVTDAFLFADGLAVITSAIGAWALWQRRRWAIVVVSITVGAVLYPTLYLVGWVSFAGTGAGCLAIMIPVSVLTSWVAWQTWRLLR